MANEYWTDRIAKAQTEISNKNIKQIEKQLKKYYNTAMKRVINEFEGVYTKILKQAADGKEITPALLYQLDSYWIMQGQLKEELQKLGDKQVELLTKNFVKQFEDIYNSIALPGGAVFNTISRENVLQMINSVWVADGKTFSKRIWHNTEKLAETLNEELINIVATGNRTTVLKQKLQEEFGVSYRAADSLVRTEIAHIQIQAAQKRYQEYGIKEVEVLVDEDERTCPICAKLEGKRYPINATMPVPAHPSCRCTVIPVVE